MPALAMDALDFDTGVSGWFEGKSFTVDWASPHFGMWAYVLADRRDRPVNILEIGSWEGRSALFFLNYLPHSRITCVDTFQGSKEHHDRPAWKQVIAETEGRFDANLAAFAGRVEKIKQPSVDALPQLASRGARFDLIYVDGSHMAADVRADAVLGWDVLNPTGIMIFDDYLWTRMPHEAERPKQGIDAFMAEHEGDYHVLHRGYQMILLRKA
jgi:predicted O-methyltransferase YrrM